MSDDGLRVADGARVEALLDRMAARLHATLDEPPALVGIRRRGAPLAERLAGRLEDISEMPVARGEIELKRYADDLSVLHETPERSGEDLPSDLGSYAVVLVDDVLYTGRTLLAAAALLTEAGAGRIHAAVLCSRDRNDMPVFADPVGMQLDVDPSFLIEVRIPPYEDELAVDVRRRPTEGR